jgi:hypothetical protein
MQHRHSRATTALFCVELFCVELFWVALGWAALGWACTGSKDRTVPEASPGSADTITTSPDSAPWLGPPSPQTARAPVDPGDALTAPVDRVCPAGTQETNDFDCLYEKRGGPPPPCACEYVCTPGCGAGETCALNGAAGTRCQCHPALEPNGGGCSWSGLLPNGNFESAQGWDLQTEGADGSAHVRIDAGQLQLSVSQRCALAWAGTTARLPARDQFPGGAALVFEYSAHGATVETHTLASALIDGFVPGLPLPAAEGATERRCAALRDRPRLASLEFRVQVGGNCGLPVDYALTVDNVRLEADPSCR